TTEYLANPIGLDAWPPRLSWRLESPERDVRQTACQILAAADPQQLDADDGALWDSGRVETDASLFQAYGGARLKSGQRVYWKVRVWDGQGQASAWSEPGFWEMGLLRPSDWKAAWIEPDLPEEGLVSPPAPMLRSGFQVAGGVRSARAYITCHGLYELALNGRRVGEALFTPGWTSYHKRLQYQTYDVTNYMVDGANAVGVTLGDGWFRGHMGWQFKRANYGITLALLAQLVITYADGRVQVVGTGADWKAATGPILKSDIYHGEEYDARLEKAGWTEAGYDDSAWAGVKLVDHGLAQLVAPDGPPVRRQEELKPVSIFRTPNGQLVADLGQNMTGWVRLKLRGAAGTAVTLKHAEVLDADGNVYFANLRTARQTDRYVLKGGGEETFEPHFTFHGFRYVTVDGYPGELTPDALTGVVIHSDMARTGSFECSNPLLNQLQHNILWGQKGNFLDVPTDCPQRDERMGWTGDAQTFLRTGAFNMDVAGFAAKWLKDVAADQAPDGAVPHVVPDVLFEGGATGWGDAAVICPWTIYQCYGDLGILARQYKSMAAWVEYMRQQAGDDFIWSTGTQFGDWLAVPSTDMRFLKPVTANDLIETAFFAYSTSLLQQTAVALGKARDAAKYARLLKRIKAAFRKEFVTPSGRVGSDSQTGYVLALMFDLLEPKAAAEAARRLEADVRARGNELTTGFLGAAFLPHVLSRYGYVETAYALLERTAYPSWLYPVLHGATTIWERWDGLKPDGTFQDVGMNSFNHYAYGAVGDWMYRVVAGMEIDAQVPGYKRIIIDPHPGGSLSYARAWHDSPYGRIESGWTLADGAFELSVTVPANTEAEVHLPADTVEAVMESGVALSETKGVREARTEAGQVVVRVASGRYQFLVKAERGE
ncbi:MAG: glycoside hydrolase family 78 protein, partial [Anaerolineales bacterium]